MAEMKLGKLVHQKGQYYLEVEGKQTLLPFTLPTDEKMLQQLVEQDVEVFYAEPSPVAFRPAKTEQQAAFKFQIVTCYVPAEWLKIITVLHPEDVQAWTRDAVKMRILTQVQADKVTTRPGLK